MRKVEVLVFEGCPNVETTLAQVRAALASTNEAADVSVVLVESDEAAARLRFLGSPTVRVDGVDVESSAGARDDYGLQCRVYSIDGRLRGAPPADWIASALRGDRPREPASVPVPASSCCSGSEQ
jgi:hypothetical protein